MAASGAPGRRVASRERDHRRASIEVAPGARADEGTGDHVQSRRQCCTGIGSELDCTTLPDAACPRRRFLIVSRPPRPCWRLLRDLEAIAHFPQGIQTACRLPESSARDRLELEFPVLSENSIRLGSGATSLILPVRYSVTLTLA